MIELAKAIFQIERVPSSGLDYSPSRRLAFDLYQPYVRPEEHARYNPEEVKRELLVWLRDVSGLGPFELYVLHRLTRGDSSCLVTIGSRGAGKTATARFLDAWVRRNCRLGPDLLRPIVARADGNSVHIPKEATPEESMKILLDQLAEQLLQAIKSHSGFLYESARDRRAGPLTAPVARVLAHIRTDFPPGRMPTEASVGDAIQRHFDSLTAEAKFQTVIHSLGFVQCSPRRRYGFLCIDNIDQLTPAVQRDLLDRVLSDNNDYQIPIWLPMRLGTDQRHNNGAKVHARTVHSGVTPLSEVRTRMERELRRVPESQSLPLALRAGELFLAFTEAKETGLESVFRGIAGRSVLRGLAAMSRLFASDDHVREHRTSEFNEGERGEILSVMRRMKTIGYERVMANLGELSRRHYASTIGRVPRPHHYVQLLIRECEKTIDSTGPLIENLFNHPAENRQSTLKFEILREVERGARERNESARLGDLLKYCHAAGYEPGEVCRAIDSLHQFDRRLIWCAGGPYEFQNVEVLERHASESIGITASGRLYLTTLLENLDYVSLMLGSSLHDRKALDDRRISIRLPTMARVFYDALHQEMKRLYVARENGRVASASILGRPQVLELEDVLLPLLEQIDKIFRFHIKSLSEEDREGLRENAGEALDLLADRHRMLLARAADWCVDLRPDWLRLNWASLRDELEKRKD